MESSEADRFNWESYCLSVSTCLINRTFCGVVGWGPLFKDLGSCQSLRWGLYFGGTLLHQGDFCPLKGVSLNVAFAS